MPFFFCVLVGDEPVLEYIVWVYILYRIWVAAYSTYS